MLHRVIRNLVASALVLGAAAVVDAQSPRPMGIVDLLNIPRLTDPHLSPDGQTVVFTKSEADWKNDKHVSHIWRALANGQGTPVQLTTGTEGETSPRWSPDGKTIAFTSKRNGEEFVQLHLLPADGGEARQLTHHASEVSEIAWAPDGSAIYFIAPEAKTAEEKAREKAKDDVYAFDENYRHKHLWKVAVPDGAESRITSGDFSITAYDISDDGRRIACHRAPTPLLGSGDDSEVWVMNADGSAATQLTKNHVQENDVRISPDGTQVLFLAGANAKYDTYYNGRVFVAPASGGDAHVAVGEREPVAVDRAFWSADGKSIYFLANLGVHEELFVMPAAGGPPRQLTSGAHAIANASPSHDRFVFTMADATSPGDVWMLAPNRNVPVRVTHVFDYLTRDFKLGRQESIQWKGADGATVEGLLTYPVDYRPGQKSPLAVMTHGGPQASDKYGIGSATYEIQVLAGKGYAVLQPNYRGSTGYGDAFLRDMVGHYFNNAHLDVMTGVDEVIRRGVADPERMVKMGWSGGGHMTNKLITFTDRFKAASSGAGAANWISMYAQTDIRAFRTPWFGGTPWQANAPFERYWNDSPLKNVANVKTPTIFFVGEKDPRVPMPQSIEMFRGLKSNNVPTHLYVAPREPHGWSELRHQLFKVNTEVAWFERYATRRPFTPEKAPGDETPPTRSTSEQ